LYKFAAGATLNVISVSLRVATDWVIYYPIDMSTWNLTNLTGLSATAVGFNSSAFIPNGRPI
jgi:hypothetical protein